MKRAYRIAIAVGIAAAFYSTPVFSGDPLEDAASIYMGQVERKVIDETVKSTVVPVLQQIENFLTPNLRFAKESAIRYGMFANCAMLPPEQAETIPECMNPSANTNMNNSPKPAPGSFNEGQAPNSSPNDSKKMIDGK